MKLKLTALFCSMQAIGLMATTPVVSDVTVTPAGDRIYANSSFSYTISGEPGIVTFHLETNGVPVDCPYVNVSGDMNMFVQPGKHSFAWRNDLDLPGATIRSKDCRLVVKAWSTNSPPDYLVYNLATPSEAPRYYEKAADVPGGVTATKYKTTHLVMRRIHAAGQSFIMGTPANDPAYNSQKPGTGLHEVAFTRDFYIGIYELTFGQMLKAKSSGSTVVTAYYNVYGPGKSKDNAELYAEVRRTDDLHYSRAAAMTQYKWYWFGTGNVYPASGKTCASSMYMQAFRTATGNPTMFLPTSYQWEFACRAGCSARLYSGSRASSGDEVDALGWHSGNNTDDPDWYKVEGLDLYLPHVVGLKRPNAWGLYDMLGNVGEICADITSDTPLTNADGTPIVDPTGPYVATNLDKTHPLCGGDLKTASTYLCAGYWTAFATTGGELNVGFRLVCDVEVSR